MAGLSPLECQPGQGHDGVFKCRISGLKYYLQHTTYMGLGYVVYHIMLWLVSAKLQKVVGEF